MSRFVLVRLAKSTEQALLELPEWTFIPRDDSNPKYQAYLAWVAEGNTAEEWNPNAN